MSTLLLRLAGPMQAWGTQSRFEARDTEREPTKSGVIGLLCAALGRPREAPLDDLRALRMAARVDSEGSLEMDYQTAGTLGIRRSSGSVRDDAVLSRRYYLADADFLVGLEGDEALLRSLDTAVDQPRWQLCLGRKAMPPGWPVRMPDDGPWGPGLCDDTLEGAFERVPHFPSITRARRSQHRLDEALRVVIDDPTGDEIRHDVPLSFAKRQFASRSIRTYWVTPRAQPSTEE